VTTAASLVTAVVDPTGDVGDSPPHAASTAAPPIATNARNREAAFMSSS
jgi:hypothetical protein